MSWSLDEYGIFPHSKIVEIFSDDIRTVIKDRRILTMPVFAVGNYDFDEALINSMKIYLLSSYWRWKVDFPLDLAEGFLSSLTSSSSSWL